LIAFTPNKVIELEKAMDNLITIGEALKRKLCPNVIQDK